MIVIKMKKPSLAMPGKGWLIPGIRMKLFGFLLPLAFLLVFTVAWAGSKITDAALRKDLLQRGAAISRVVALSAGYSLLANDQLALDRLAAETRESGPDIDFVAIRDTRNKVVAHNRIGERGKPFAPSARMTPLGTFADTHADEVVRDGLTLIEFSTPIHFAGRLVGTSTLALTTESLVAASRSVRRSIMATSSIILGLAFFGTLLMSSLITTRVKRLHEGVLSLVSGEPFRPIPVDNSDELGDLTRKFNRMADEILAQKAGLQAQARQLEEAYIGMVRVIAASLDARDPYTLGHSTRVAKLSCELGRRLGLSEENLIDLERAAIFHDLGKIQTPDSVLLKREHLSDDEEERMRNHPMDGTEILRGAPFLRRYIPAVRSHHEWFNGDGYPDGKKGHEIPFHAQVIALADAFDAMTSNRPYRQALDTEEALEEILRFRGTQFSPELADAFAKMVRELPPMDEATLRSMAL
ncbi:MAG: putative phosphohydrolase [Deltaproteobacteria bacterium]|nr:putative phosphohydrolase [Deltaproteobacteria bacterium]